MNQDQNGIEIWTWEIVKEEKIANESCKFMTEEMVARDNNRGRMHEKDGRKSTKKKNNI